MPNDLPAEPTVQCVNCGYVSLRRRSTRALSEVEVAIRATGVIPPENDPKRPGELTYEQPIICFRQRFNLHHEQQTEIGGNVSQADRILHVLNKSRRCGKFKQWEQGFTPKEHADMDLIEREKARQDARDASSRQFQAEQAKLADQRHEQALQAAANREATNQAGQWKRTIVTLIAGGLITLAIGWLRDGIRTPATPVQPPTPSAALPAK